MIWLSLTSFENALKHVLFWISDRKKWQISFIKMSVEQVVEKLKNEINERNRKDIIDNLEEMLSENVKEISKNENFFQFWVPLESICTFAQIYSLVMELELF